MSRGKQISAEFYQETRIKLAQEKARRLAAEKVIQVFANQNSCHADVYKEMLNYRKKYPEGT